MGANHEDKHLFVYGVLFLFTSHTHTASFSHIIIPFRNNEQAHHVGFVVGLHKRQKLPTMNTRSYGKESHINCDCIISVIYNMSFQGAVGDR